MWVESEQSATAGQEAAMSDPMAAYDVSFPATMAYDGAPAEYWY
jgi:hypothetical protein